MKQLLVFVGFSVIMVASMLIGSYMKPKQQYVKTEKQRSVTIPSIGRVEVLNGCGISGIASVVADFLRSNKFDVKNIGNALTWNYTETIIVARTNDMKTAKNLCKLLNTNKLILLRNGGTLYDATIFIGNDFGELIDDK